MCRYYVVWISYLPFTDICFRYSRGEDDRSDIFHYSVFRGIPFCSTRGHFKYSHIVEYALDPASVTICFVYYKEIWPRLLYANIQQAIFSGLITPSSWLGIGEKLRKNTAMLEGREKERKPSLFQGNIGNSASRGNLHAFPLALYLASKVFPAKCTTLVCLSLLVPLYGGNCYSHTIQRDL